MAAITGEVTSSANFAALAKAWPDIAFYMSRTIGKNSRELLYYQFLSGQEINLKAYPRDKAGRNTVSSASTGKNTKISSYPTNLFERGRTLRSGARDPGKYIITRKLKAAVGGRLQGWVDSFESKEIQKAFDRV